MAFANPHLLWPWRLVYRSLLILVSGWLLATLLAAPVQAQATWLQSKAHGDIAYFLFAAPARLERYDLAAATWLTPIALPATPTAFAVDSDGLYVAFDRSVSRLPLAGGEATHLKNAATTITDLFTVNGFLYLNHSAYPNGNLTSINKITGLTIDSKAYLYKVFRGMAVGPTLGKAFARDTGMSPADMVQVTLNNDGTLGAASDSPYHGAYPDAAQTFIFPDESRVVDSAGIVYNTADLRYNTSLAGAVDDLAFGDDVTVVLRNGSLLAYNQQLLETGVYTPPTKPRKIYLAGAMIMAFAPSAERGVQVAAIALAQLRPATPGPALDPVGLSYTPDAVLLVNDDILYLFSKARLSIFRWSVAARRYLPTIALSQTPTHVAYSPVTNRLYLAYPAGKITQIPLADGVSEQPFANSPQTPCGLATAGEYVFVCDPSGAWESHFTYHPDGALISQQELNYFSKAYVWSAANRKLYFFRDDTSPNDLLWEVIDSEGKIGAKQDSPYHSSEGILHPIRVAPDGAVVLLGSGRLYDANSLTQVDSLANPITDAAWHNGRLYTTRQFTDQTQVQRWGTTYGLEKRVDLVSTATNLFAVEEGLLAVTNDQGMPRFVLLDDELNILYQSATLVGLQASNDSPTTLGNATNFTATVQRGANVSYQWDFGDGGTASGATVSHVYGTDGVYTATVTATNSADVLTAQTQVRIVAAEPGCTPIAAVVVQPAAANIAVTGNVQSFRAVVAPATAVNGAMSYQFFVNDQPIAPLFSTHTPSFDYTFGDPANYVIGVVVDNGCSEGTASTTVAIQTRPTDQPDLSQSSKSVTLANVDLGDILTYTIHLRNQQTVAAQVTLTDTPSGYTPYLPNSFQVSSGESWIVDHTLFWSGEVISGTPVFLTYAVRVENVPVPGAPLDQQITSSGLMSDQFGNTFSLNATSAYNPGYRLSINDGALYTNQPQVTLHYSWDTNHAIQFVKFSNDGGFGAAANTTDWLPVNAQHPVYANWPLATQNNTLLPRTVYALFRTSDGSQVGPFQDDIILDTLPPKLLQVTWLTAAQRSGQVDTAEAQVRVMASDENSGITAVEFSGQPDFGAATAYPMTGTTLDLTLTPPPAGRLYVRARDRAGNHSTVQTLTSDSSIQIFLPVVTR